ncbi:hypothetical protein NQ318_001952 [Aromia moschata]|uniref:RNA-directed DNA polymerase n=1 Tax=Aromia moschata TaxID=1265417 RepID=A0AAV8Z4A2_9CUCU|nr:hypothetical protein NQ318_001952 [Aromia moschata]
MTSRQVFLKDLKVADLKRELEERECETTGKKADLQNRLKEALENEESGEQQRVVNTALKSPGSDIDRLSKPELSSPVEISKIRMKPPQFDGKSSWVNYLRQFEAAARANGWSLAEKATALTLALRVKHLEMRYGQSHLEHVYHSQLKNRYQKSNESLQEFEADIARLVRLAYSSTPENVMERLAVQAFLDASWWMLWRELWNSKLLNRVAEVKLRSVGWRKVLKKEPATKQRLGESPRRYWIRGQFGVGIVLRLTVVNDDWQRDELLRDQENDPNLKPIVNWKKEDRKPTWEEVSRDGLLKRVLEKSDGTEERKQLIVPRNRVPGVLEEIHNGSTGGHLGVTKTLGKVRERFYWVNCTTDVKEWCKKCVVCVQVMFLHLFLLAYRSSVHETTGQTPASIVMGRELRLPCDLKFGCTPGDDVAGKDYVSTLRQRMDDIHERVRSNIQGASDRMKETYDINANDGRYQPGNQVWLYNPQRRRGLSPKLQSSWEGPYEVVTRINDVVYRIQKLPRGKPRVVHFNRLAPFAGSNDEQAEARVRHVSPPDGELSFEEFMSLHSNGQKARYGVTREEPRDLFQTPADFCLAHCAFGQLEELRRQRPEVGRVLQITAAEQEKERSVFYLVTKQLSHHKPTYQTVWDTLVELRVVLLSQSISSLAIPKIASGLDGLDWRVIRSMLEVLFRFTGIEILVCCYNPRRSLNEKTVDCFFYQTSRCKNGSFCRYRHRPGDDTIRDEMSLRRGQCYERWASPPAVLTPADQSSR